VSFFEELKRRNVVRVGIAYVLLGWVVMQGADFLLDLVGAPEWVIRVFAIAGLVGLPFALFFAWAFELTPDGIKRESEVDRTQSIAPQTGRKLDRTIIVFLALAVAGLLADKFIPDNPAPAFVQHVETAPAATQVPDATEISEQSIAVLPFVDMSPEGDQAYFADGIAEEILNVLVKTHSLKVAGRTSSFQFSGRNEDLRMIGKELGVEHILEGSIRKDQNRVRITAQLVKADDGFHLWSETYDRELTDIFAIQDEIARAITDALAIELDLVQTGPRLAAEQTGNMEAYDHYLEARALIGQRQDLERAIELLDGAIEHDPDFAQAWAANAQAHSLAPYYLKDVSTTEYLADAERMANRALEINPLLSQAHSVLGDVYRDRQEWPRSEASYQRALSLNPDDVEANSQYAQMLLRGGLYMEAIPFSTRAAELDPLSFINLSVHACILYLNGQRETAWRQMEKALVVSPGDDVSPRIASRMALSEGSTQQAVDFYAQFERFRSKPSGQVRELLDVLPEPQSSLAVLKSQSESEMPGEASDVFWEQATWAVYFGDPELAGVLLRKATDPSKVSSILFMDWVWFPLMNPLHQTEAFKDVIRQSGLDRFWAATRYPEICRPVGEDDFACSMETMTGSE
jgi:TolB-like protein/Tfp pilus assembly protein PilF